MMALFIASVINSADIITGRSKLPNRSSNIVKILIVVIKLKIFWIRKTLLLGIIIIITMEYI